MDVETGQSEELNTEASGQVDENGELTEEGNANAGTESEHEGENGEQGQTQSKSRSAKARLRRKLQESEAEKARTADENRKLAEKLHALEQKVEGVLNPPKPRPSRVDFDTEAEYEDAVWEWRNQGDLSNSSAETGESGEVERKTTTEQPTYQVADEVVDKWLERCDDAADRYEDFDDVVSGNPELPISIVMRDALMENDNGAEIAYYLGKNAKEAERIYNLSPVSQVRAIDKIAESFKSSKISNAPDPITPPKGNDNTAGVNPETLSPEEYVKWRRSQKRA